MILRNFFVFEGIDGSGTSTQVELLKKSPQAGDFFFTAEPTDGEIGRFLRRMLGGDVKVDARTSAYLFAADRAEHVWGAGGVAETCAAGKKVVSDRYIFSSLAYQGTTCGEDFARLLQRPFPLPETLFFFRIDPETSLSRIGGRGRREIYEVEEFLRKTEERYEKVVEEYRKNAPEMKIVELDAKKSAEEVKREIWGELGVRS